MSTHPTTTTVTVVADGPTLAKMQFAPSTKLLSAVEAALSTAGKAGSECTVHTDAGTLPTVTDSQVVGRTPKVVRVQHTLDEQFAALRATMDADRAAAAADRVAAAADRAAMQAAMDADRAANVATRTHLSKMQLPVVAAHIVRYTMGVDTFRKSSKSDHIRRISRDDRTLGAFAALRSTSVGKMATALDGVISERNRIAHPVTVVELDGMVKELRAFVTPVACASYEFEWWLVEQYEALKGLPGVAQRFQSAISADTALHTP